MNRWLRLSPEAGVGAAFGQRDVGDQLAVGREHVHAFEPLVAHAPAAPEARPRSQSMPSGVPPGPAAIGTRLTAIPRRHAPT